MKRTLLGIAIGLVIVVAGLAASDFSGQFVDCGFYINGEDGSPGTYVVPHPDFGMEVRLRGANGISVTSFDEDVIFGTNLTEIGGTNTWGAGATHTWIWDAGAIDPTISFISDLITITNAANIIAASSQISASGILAASSLAVPAPADLTAGACTANSLQLDSGGATVELCFCNSGGTAFNCWDVTTVGGPKD